MIARWERLAGATLLTVAAGLGGCAVDRTPRTSAPESTATVDVATSPASDERPGTIEGDYVYAENVERWLKIGSVTNAISGRVVGVVVGPAVTETDFDRVAVVNTALLQVEVDEVFMGRATAGDVVPVALFAGSGTVVQKGDPVPTTPDKHGTSIEEFEEAFPAGTRVVAMSNPHPITIFQGSSANSAVYPPGLPERDEYMTGTHPQALAVEDNKGIMSGWDLTYDQLVGALRTAT